VLYNRSYSIPEYFLKIAGDYTPYPSLPSHFVFRTA
jgi:hypothetical protein